jgi:hypothetical protein
VQEGELVRPLARRAAHHVDGLARGVVHGDAAADVRRPAREVLAALVRRAWPWAVKSLSRPLYILYG